MVDLLEGPLVVVLLRRLSDAPHVEERVYLLGVGTRQIDRATTSTIIQRTHYQGYEHHEETQTL